MTQFFKVFYAATKTFICFDKGEIRGVMEHRRTPAEALTR